MMNLSPEDHARLVRDRLLEEKRRHDLLRQAGTRPFYAPLLALLGRTLAAIGLWLQAHSAARQPEPHLPIEPATGDTRWQGAR